MPIVDPAAAQAVLTTLARVAWDTDLNEFARRLGKPPTDPWVRETFLVFQKAADAARQFADSAAVLTAVFAPTPAGAADASPRV